MLCVGTGKVIDDLTTLGGERLTHDEFVETQKNIKSNNNHDSLKIIKLIKEYNESVDLEEKGGIGFTVGYAASIRSAILYEMVWHVGPWSGFWISLILTVFFSIKNYRKYKIKKQTEN